MFEIDEQTIFQTGTHQRVFLSDIIQRIEQFISEDPDREYRLSVGTDSMTYDATYFVLAIVVHRVGNGGIYFYKRFQHPAIRNLRDKLYQETQLSIDATDLLIGQLLDQHEELFEKLKLSIHLDIGENGPTKDLIRELEGWVHALGYDCAIKPESYAASTIANIHSK